MKLIFKLPLKKRLLIFDPHNINFLLSCIKKFDYGVMPVRYEELNVAIIFKTFINYNFNLKFMQNYIINYVRFTRPKIIISFIDNNVFFYKLKNYFPGIKTVVIQNGLSTQPFFEKIKKNKNLKVDYAFCWGNGTSTKFKNFFKANTYKIGSMRNNTVKISKKSRNTKKIYFISGFGSSFKNNLESDLVQKKIYNISKILDAVYEVYEKKFTFHVLKKTNSNDEVLYLQKIFKDKKFFMEQKIDSFSNYKVCDKNKFFISFDSAMGFEALSRGARVLFLNINNCFSINNKKFDILWGSKLPKNGAFWLSKPNKNEIKKKLIFLINSSEKKWKFETNKFKQFIFGHDENNAKFKKALNNIILSLNEK